MSAVASPNSAKISVNEITMEAIAINPKADLSRRRVRMATCNTPKSIVTIVATVFHRRLETVFSFRSIEPSLAN